MNGITISLEASIKEMQSAKDLANVAPAQLRKQTYIAMNQATKDGMRVAVKDIAGRVALAQKVVSDAVVQTKKATAGKLESEFAIVEGERVGLKYFGATQTRKGVTYRISKTGGRKLLPGAFGLNIGKLGGHVYKRSGKARFPIIKQFGVSPWGVFAKNDLLKPTADATLERFDKRLRARVRYLSLKETGVI